MFTTSITWRMCTGLFLFIGFHTFAQVNGAATHIQITFNKTSSIIFPAAIKSVDRGSRDILAQKAKQVENVLQVKAGRKNFPETNLTIITADGKLHSFILNYTEKPEQLIWFTNEPENRHHDIFLSKSVDENQLQQKSNRILSDKRQFLFKTDSKFGITLSLDGIYVEDALMFYRLHITNSTNINYDVESIRVYIIDKQKTKRTASQEIQINPVYASEQVRAITAQSKVHTVYTMDKFTIPDAKKLIIELFEKRGGRHVKLLIRNRTIIHAKPIPE